MAKSNGINNVAMYLNLAILLSSLLITNINMAESKLYPFGLLGHSKVKTLTSGPPYCFAINAAKEGDTCFSISQAMHYSVDVFLEINPNLNCDKIFVGEWLCVL